MEVVKWMWKEYGVEYLIALCHILCIALLWNGIGLTEVLLSWLSLWYGCSCEMCSSKA